MKKRLLAIIFSCFCIQLFAFANGWVEVDNKTYVNIEKYQGNKVFYWCKMLNDGTMKALGKQKVGYTMNYYIEDCSKNSSALLASYIYDLSGKTISSYTSTFYNYPEYASYGPVIPQSIGESIHEYACGDSKQR